MDNNEKGAIFDSSKEIKWGGWLNEFLWICAGVNRKVLRQCPTDYAKYAGIGGTILFTALMACLSGGYALSFVFNDMYVGIAFGIFWGLLIFNLDRFIVNTMYSDGKVTISARELKAGLPRIIMAIFLGIVISYPLELKLFDDEIKIKIDDMKKSRLDERVSKDRMRIDSLEHRYAELMETPPSFNESDIAMGNEDLVALTKKQKDAKVHFDQKQQEINALQYALNRLNNSNDKSQNEEEIQAKNAKIRSLKIERNSYRNTIENIQREIRRLSPEINRLIEDRTDKINCERSRVRAEADSLKNKTDNAEKEYGDKLKEFEGLQAQMLAFSEIKDENTSTYIASLLIMMLFIIIETAPTFFKMMIASGPYDDLLRAEMHRVRVLSDKRISDVNDEINVSQQISTANNEERLRAEVEANKEVLAQVAQAQSSLLKFAIEEWEKAERQKIAEDPSKYINGFGKTEVSVPEVKGQKSSKKKNKKQAKAQNQPQPQPQAQSPSIQTPAQSSIQVPTQPQGQSRTASQPEPANNQQTE